MSWHLPFRLAARELRAGFRQFRIFLVCLSLAVAGIAAVGSLSAALLAGLHAEGRAILGGDISLRFRNQQAPPATFAWLQQHYDVSHVTTLRGMAQRTGHEGVPQKQSLLVEIKSVDAAYPLAGELKIDPPMPLQQALAYQHDLYGIIVEPRLLTQLGLTLGSHLRLGAAVFEIRATSLYEPDRLAGGFAFGRHVMVSKAGLQASQLAQPGSLMTHHYRLRLAPPASAAQLQAAHTILETELANTGGRIRDRNDASPSLRRNIERIAVFLTLIGLMTLVVGGVGMGNAVHAWLDSRRNVIATLKCLGAPSRLIYVVYFLQIFGLALFGICIGLAIGAAAPFIAQFILAGRLPFALQISLYPSALAAAGGFGLLAAFAFALAPLARACRLPSAALFRDHLGGVRPPLWPVLPLLSFGYMVCFIGFAAITALVVQRVDIVFWFLMGLGANCLLLYGAAHAFKHFADWARRNFKLNSPILRLALANISRPGAPVLSVILSMGLAISLLAAIALTATNITRQINQELPQDAPNFFMIDVQPSQYAPLRTIIENHVGVEKIVAVPLLRGRITHVKNIQAAKLNPPESVAWVLRGDRGLTYAAIPPEGAQIVAGQWWAKDYQGDPLISIEDDVARGLGLEIGDVITVNILGRPLTARIANFRKINWRNIAINFTLVFSPQPLADAPHSHFISVRMHPDGEADLQNNILAQYPNISIIHVKEMIALVNGILRDFNFAVQIMSFVSVLAGILVLAGAIASGHRARLYDGVVMKVLGASRAHIVAAYMLEYALLGLGTACIAALFGSLAAWGLVTQIMDLGWLARWDILAGLIFATGFITIFLGLFGTWRVLGRKSVPVLRSP